MLCGAPVVHIAFLVVHIAFLVVHKELRITDLDDQLTATLNAMLNHSDNSSWATKIVFNTSVCFFMEGNNFCLTLTVKSGIWWELVCRNKIEFL